MDTKYFNEFTSEITLNFFDIITRKLSYIYQMPESYKIPLV